MDDLSILPAKAEGPTVNPSSSPLLKGIPPQTPSSLWCIKFCLTVQSSPTAFSIFPLLGKENSLNSTSPRYWSDFSPPLWLPTLFSNWLMHPLWLGFRAPHYTAAALLKVTNSLHVTASSGQFPGFTDLTSKQLYIQQIPLPSKLPAHTRPPGHQAVCFWILVCTTAQS